MPILGVDWAADMAAAFGGDFADGSILHVVSSARTPGALTGPLVVTTTTHTCKALGFAYERRFIDGTTVKIGDLQVIILRDSISPPVLPAPGDTITCSLPGGASVAVKAVGLIAVTDAFVTVHVRGPGA